MQLDSQRKRNKGWAEEIFEDIVAEIWSKSNKNNKVQFKEE